MPASFFWLALFPIFLGAFILLVFIIFLKREGKKPPKGEHERITSEEFIDEVARYCDTDPVKAERMIDFVFSYFPGFSWRKNLPKVREVSRDEGKEGRAKES